MPRTARKKSSESIYHIMNRSISEIDLFQCNDDKDYYLNLLKKYKDKFNCSIYAYCLMDNHVHLYINPKGFDISKFMHCLNSAYVSYFNRKYERHGHLFQGRFASKIVTTDSYSLSLSAYIHNNPKDIKTYKGREEYYSYSSYGIYIGKMIDKYNLIDREFILNLFSNDIKEASKKYYEFTKIMIDTGVSEEIDEDIINEYTKNEYRDEKYFIERDVNPDDVVKMVCELEEETTTFSIRSKYSRNKSRVRALVAYGMRLFCGYTFKKIGEYIGDMSLSGVVRLSNQGYNLYINNSKYQKAFKTLELVA